MKKGIIAAILAAGALMLTGCGHTQPKLPEGTPTDASGQPTLPIEKGRKYYVSNAEDYALQEKIAKAFAQAINENPGEMDAEKIEWFRSDDKTGCSNFKTFTKKGPNGLIMHLAGRWDFRPDSYLDKSCGYGRVSFSNYVATYRYDYDLKKRLSGFGSNGPEYGHRYRASVLDGGRIELMGFKDRREAVDLYLHLHGQLDDLTSDLWDTTTEAYGEGFNLTRFYGKMLMDFDPEALDEQNRLIIRLQILDGSMKRPLEDVIEQLGGIVVDTPAKADILVGTKVIGFPPGDDVKQVMETIEDGDIDMGFNDFQSEISTVGLGGSLAHAGYGNLGGAVAGLGVAMVLFGGNDRYVRHHGLYVVEVVDAKAKRRLWSRFIHAGGKKGKWCPTNSPVYLQELAYDAVGELVGRSNYEEAK